MAFTADLLNQPLALKRLFSGEAEVSEILRSKPTSLSCFRAVCILITSPIQILVSSIFTALAALFNCIGYPKAYCLFSVLARHAFRPLEQLVLEKIHLTYSINAHKLENWDLYLHPELPRNFIQNPLVKAALSDSSVSKLKFSNLKGLCRGAVDWFIFLVLKTQGKFPSLKDQLIAIANQFITGVPLQGVLLQTFKSFDSSPNYFLNMQKELILAFDGKSIDLEPGCYSFYLSKHLMAYFKQDDETAFIWNPNGGLTDLSGKNQVALLQNYLMNRWKKDDLGIYFYKHSFTGILACEK